MRVNRVSLIALLLSFSALSPVCPKLAFAKGNDGHGGGALVCKEPKDNELLDLWEATVPGLFRKERLKIKRRRDSVAAQITKALLRLEQSDSDFGRLVTDMYWFVLANKEDLRSDDPPLLPISDAFTNFYKPGCDLEPVANYFDDTEVLKLDPTIMATLRETDLAALWVHEAVYKTLRSLNRATSSINSRRIVGLLFSTLKLEKIKAEIAQIILETELETGPSNLEQVGPGHFAVKPGFPEDTYSLALGIIESPTNKPNCDEAHWKVSVNGRDYLKFGKTGAAVNIPISLAPDSADLHVKVSCYRVSIHPDLPEYFLVSGCSRQVDCAYNLILRDYRGQIITASVISSHDYITGKEVLFKAE